MGTEAAWVPWVVGALSAAGSVYNTQQTAKREDNALAASLRTQGKRQREADAKVNDQVTQLEASRSEGERAKRLDQYMTTLQRGRAVQQAGLTPAVGSSAFAADANAAQTAGDALAARTAGLEARIDAPSLQRQDEGFGFGRLGTDLSLIQREASGDAYLDELRRRSIRRNPWIDAASQVGMGYAAQTAGGQGIAVGEPSPYGPYASGYKYPTAYKLPSYLGG